MLLFLTMGLLAVTFAHMSFLKQNDLYLFVSLLVIVIVIAFQDSVSVDFPGYIETFDGISEGTVNAKLFRSQAERANSTEIGWYLLNLVIGSIIPSFYAVAFIAIGFYCYTLSRIIRLVVPGTYRWLAVAYFYLNPMLFNMSGIRQTVAIGFFILAVCAVLENKKWYIAVLWLICGSLFHNSMVFSLPFLAFLFMPEIKGKWVYAFMIGLTALFLLAIFVGAKNQDALFGLSSIFFSDNVDIYASYISGAEAIEYSLKSIVRLSFPFIFSLLVLPRANKTEFALITLFLSGQVLYALVGFEGNLQRITLYCTIMAVPAFMIIANHLRESWLRYIFCGGTILLNAYYLYVMMGSEQYAPYLNYNLVFLPY